MMNTAVPVVMVVAKHQDCQPDQTIGERIDGGGVLSAHPFLRCRFRIRFGAKIDHVEGVVHVEIEPLTRNPVHLDQAQISGADLTTGLFAGSGQQLDVEWAVHVHVLSDADGNLGSKLLCDKQGKLRGRKREGEFVVRTSCGNDSSVGTAIHTNLPLTT